MITEPINIEPGNILLPIARESISSALGKTHAVDERAGWLQSEGACFVTLTQNGELRGCIGTLEAHRPLLQDVKANAFAAAFRDPRFAPLTVSELEYTEIEISLLSAMLPLQFSDERDALAQLKPYQHGVVFEYGRYRSTFLPQVWEQLTDAIDFIEHLKRKAGLPSGFWAPEVKLTTYTVSKWKESELRKSTALMNAAS